MSESIRLRKTIVLQLDVMVSEETEDYLEIEITHPKLGGALYLTVNDRKEAEEKMTDMDMNDQLDEETGAKLKNYFSSPTPPAVIALPSSSPSISPATVSTQTSVRQIGPTRVSTAPVDSLVRNSVSLAGGLLDLTVSLRNLRKK